MKCYTKEEISSAVTKSYCYADVFKNLKVKLNGGSYPWIKKLIKKFDLSTDHFYSPVELQARHAARIRLYKDRRDFSVPLQNGQRLRARVLRSYMLFHKIPYQCGICEISSWMNKPLILDIDHINGDCEDNSLSNLNFLCPNCHRQKTIPHKE